MASIASSLSHIRPFVAFGVASGGGVRAAPRRLFLGLGASFLDQLRRMNSSSSSRSLTASAWPQQGFSPVEQVLKDVEWPDKFPFKDEDFSRFDESLDPLFYSEPRFVTHIDDPAISALTKYYSKVFPPSNTPGVCLLDLCSSWVSHYPAGYRQDRIVGLGMNEDELKQNPQVILYASSRFNIWRLKFANRPVAYFANDLGLKVRKPQPGANRVKAGCFAWSSRVLPFAWTSSHMQGGVRPKLQLGLRWSSQAAAEFRPSRLSLFFRFL